jgi:hypothetical protein
MEHPGCPRRQVPRSLERLVLLCKRLWLIEPAALPSPHLSDSSMEVGVDVVVVAVVQVVVSDVIFRLNSIDSQNLGKSKEVRLFFAKFFC